MSERIDQRVCRPRRSPDGWACERWRAGPNEWFCGVCAKPLPPLVLDLDPPVGRSDPAEDGKRRISVQWTATPQLDTASLGDFRIVVSTTDPGEDVGDIAPTLEGVKRQGSRPLNLTRPAGGPAFDIMLGVRHVSQPRAGEPVAVGQYDYPLPEAELDPPDAIVIPFDCETFSINVVTPPDGARPLQATLLLPELDPEFFIDAAQVEYGPAETTLTFEPDDEARAILESLSGVTEGRVELLFEGLPVPVTLKDLAVERVTPAKLELQIEDRRNALAGRPARLAARVHNVGGSAAVIERVGWRMSSAASDVRAQGECAVLKGRRLAPQAFVDEELRPIMTLTGLPAEDADTEAHIPPGDYYLEITILFGDERVVGKSVEASWTVELHVKAQATYPGLVCIDFGTTDTAAAIIADPVESYFYNSATGATPRPVELGRLAAPAPGAAPHFFLPTRAAVGIGPEGKRVTLYGRDAIEGFVELKHGRLFDRLKWRLANGRPLDGLDGKMTTVQLAGAYLDHVRRLIEEHPDVTARVERVVATRPAVFGAGRSKALVEAFGLAGMTVDQTRYGPRAPPLVSESWPPVLFMAPMPEEPGEPSARLLASLFDNFPGEILPEVLEAEALEAAPQYLCTFDVGGGSTDISLLEIRGEGGQIHVRDLATITDDKFAGEGFRDLIVDEIEAFLPDINLSDRDEIGRRNLLEVRRAAALVQNFHGPLLSQRLGWRSFFEALSRMSEEDRKAIFEQYRLDEDGIDEGALAELRTRIPETREMAAAAGRSSRMPLADALLTFVQQDGAEAAVVLSQEQEDELLVRVMVGFAARFGASIDRHLGRLASKLPDEARSGQIRVLLTGRGSLFPLTDGLIRPYAAARLSAADGIQVIAASGESAKAVTSWGALALAAARSVSRDLNFEGLTRPGEAHAPGKAPVGPSYAVYARSPRKGAWIHSLLQPLPGLDGAWGTPLEQLRQPFAHAALIEVSEDNGPEAPPDPVARLAGFDVEASLAKMPDAWLLFRTPNTLGVEALPVTSAVEKDVGEGQS